MSPHRVSLTRGANFAKRERERERERERGVGVGVGVVVGAGVGAVCWSRDPKTFRRSHRHRARPGLSFTTPIPRIQLISTLGALSPRGGPVQDPVLTPSPFPSLPTLHPEPCTRHTRSNWSLTRRWLTVLFFWLWLSARCGARSLLQVYSSGCGCEPQPEQTCAGLGVFFSRVGVHMG